MVDQGRKWRLLSHLKQRWEITREQNSLVRIITTKQTKLSLRGQQFRTLGTLLSTFKSSRWSEILPQKVAKNWQVWEKHKLPLQSGTPPPPYLVLGEQVVDLEDRRYCVPLRPAIITVVLPSSPCNSMSWGGMSNLPVQVPIVDASSHCFYHCHIFFVYHNEAPSLVFMHLNANLKWL